jgi:DEAD/DEAH box helicase domain-containing protein
VSGQQPRFPRDASLSGLVAAVVDVEPSEGEFSDFPPGLPGPVAGALQGSGIRSLYRHQRECFDLAAAGENVVVATPAASGKSLCYLLPILAGLHEDPDAAAMLLFPTKALSRDQEAAVGGLLRASGIDSAVVTYDGDTPREKRRQLRSQAGVLITNPDMLHAAILPRHTAWADLFSTLRTIVIDEIHQYRGVFGSHVANVLRRLQRVLDFYGADPVWIAASATIGNPHRIAQDLTGRPFRLVDRAAAPSPGRTLLVFNAPLVDARSGVRQSFMKLAARITLDLLDQEMQTIVFANSRHAVEMLVRYLQEALKEGGKDPGCVKGYRGGYLPAQRRAIEDEIKSGKIRCVVATSALELGIDIGRLDAAVLAGYPGTIAGLWQRVGRVGRRRRRGIAALVAGGSPIDQFLVRHPGYITESNPESCYINPDNIDILIPHLRCAVSEIPFTTGEPYALMEWSEVREVLDFFTGQGETTAAGDRIHWVSSEAPARTLSLRTAGSERFAIIDEDAGRVIEEIEKTRVLRSLHPRAIYQHSGQQYEVTGIDFDAGRVSVRETSVDYYTEPITEERLVIIDEYDSGRAGRLDIALGEIRITQRVAGFKCIQYMTGEILSAHEAELPEQEMEVYALWLKVRSALLAAGDSARVLEDREFARRTMDALSRKHPVGLMMNGLKGLGYLMTRIGALRLMCDPRDLGASVACDFVQSPGPDDQATGFLYLYEMFPGGVGIARGFYELFPDIAGECLDVVTACGCRSGCPSCVGPPDGRDDLRKTASILIFDTIM